MAQWFTDPVKNINRQNPLKISLFIAGIAGMLFIPFIGAIHLFDWDEINFAEAAREMLITGDFLRVRINFQAFHEKPPLFIWMQVLSMKVFGINEFAARFPNALCGIATLVTLFWAGRTLNNNLLGILWALAYAGSVLPFFYFKSGIIDPWFNLFIFLAVWFLFQSIYSTVKKKYSLAVLSGIFTGLAILTKGPVAVLIIAVAFIFFMLFMIYRRTWKGFSLLQFLIYTLATILTGGSWFTLQLFTGHQDTILEFITYQIRLFSTEDAGHGGFPGYHIVTLLLTVFPASILALRGFRKPGWESEIQNHFTTLMLILLLVVIILFSVVKTKIVHYSSLAYFPVSLLAADFILRAYYGKTTWKKWMTVVIMVISFLYATLFILITFAEKLKGFVLEKNLIADPFTLEKFKTDVHWSGFEWIAGLLFFIFITGILFYIKSHRVLLRGVLLFCCTMFFTLSLIYTVTPRVEKYLQNGFVNQLKTFAGKDIYLWNYMFRSYATWFYGKSKPPAEGIKITEEWLLSGDIDKDVMIISKIHRAEPLQENRNLTYAGESDGFVFYLRKAD